MANIRGYDTLFSKCSFGSKRGRNKAARIESCCQNCCQKIETIWNKASLPTLSHKRVVDLILQYNNKYQTAIKPIKCRKTSFLTAKLEKFKNDAQQLFDICSCKCLTKLSCNCDKTRKIPEIEWAFINDQRSERKMVIGNIDIEVTAKFKKRNARKIKNIQRGFNNSITVSFEEPVAIAGPSGLCENKLGNKNVPFTDSESESDNSLHKSSTHTEDKDFVWYYPLARRSKQKKQRHVSQMRLSLTRTVKAADLTDVSCRTVAKIANAVLEDMNLISKDNSAKVVDKNKIRREVNKNRLQLQEAKINVYIKGLYFDGRKDQTIFQEKGRRISKTEEHIALIEEPGSLFCGHVAVTQSRATDISEGILFYTKAHNIELSQLKVIGCDGTNVNTGWRGGVIRQLETKLNKPLRWSIYLLHGNELPLRHLLQKLDGHTKGPYTYSGPIGSLLSACEKMPTVKFKSIKTDLPHVDENDLRLINTIYLRCVKR